MSLNQIEAIRKTKGLTREDLGKAIEKSPLTIWRYENSKSAITDTALRRIAKVLNVRVGDLLDDDATAPTPAVPHA